MKRFISFTLLVSLQLTFSLSLEYSELIDPFNAKKNPCNDLRNGQFVCTDCGTLGFCKQENGAWLTVELTTCQTEHNLYCDEEARGCIFKQSCKESSRGPKFECQNSGIFPDPYDCKYYHVCDNKMVGERFRCPSNTAYSPATRTCSLPVNADICLAPQYECGRLGQMGSWPTDSSIYYVCHATTDNGNLVRYPVLYHCQSGFVFDGTKCVQYTSSTVAPPVAPTSVPEIKTCVPGTDLAPNAYDCYSYLVCVNGLLVSNTCPTGTHFSDTTKSCVFGKC